MAGQRLRMIIQKHFNSLQVRILERQNLGKLCLTCPKRGETISINMICLWGNTRKVCASGVAIETKTGCASSMSLYCIEFY